MERKRGRERETGRAGERERQGEREREREREIKSLCHLYDAGLQPSWEPVVSPWASCWGDP